MRLCGFCIKRPVFTTVLSLVLVVLGVLSYNRVPVRGYPKISPPVIVVSTEYDGASANIVESEITNQIENELAGISGLKEMHSTSSQGESRVVLIFNLGVDLNTAANDVRDLISGNFLSYLPTGAKSPNVQKRDPDQNEILSISLRDKHMNDMALTDYGQRYILPELQQIMGVASVELENARDYAMRIDLNPEEMAAKQVTVGDMSEVLRNQNVNTPSGQIKATNRYYSVYLQGELNNAKAFNNLILRDESQYLLRFKDVAFAHVAPSDTDSAMRIDGVPSVGFSVYAESTANPIKVAEGVRKSIQKIQEKLPAGMSLQVVYDDTKYLQESLSHVYRDLAFAIFLVVIVVLLFLGSWRSAVIPIVTIPICLIGVFSFIYAMNYSLNIFTALALVLAIGLVVDDAIVMLENIYQKVETGLKPVAAAELGSREIAFAVVAMTITLAAVYAPIGFAQGITGMIFREFAFVLAMTVILSGFVALTLSPMMCAKMLKPVKKESRYSSWLNGFFQRIIFNYQKLLKKILHIRLIVVGVLLVIMGGGYWLFHHMPSALVPPEDMGVFQVSITPPSNASFKYTDNYSKKVEALLKKEKGVKHTLMYVDPTSGYAWVILDPRNERSRTSQQIIDDFVKKAERDYPGVSISAYSPGTIGGGGHSGDSVRITLMSNIDYAKLHDVAKRFIKKIKSYPGIIDASDSLQLDNVQYTVKVNHNLAASLKVNSADIADTLHTMLGGAKVTRFSWEGRDYDVILQVPQDKLSNLDIIDSMYVRSSAGQMIPLSSLASIQRDLAPMELPHYNRLRADTITIQGNSKYTMGQIVNYVKQEAKKELPQSVSYQFRGAAKHMLDSSSTMVITFGLALLFIYLVLAAQFESFIDPFIILFSVPLSVVGALFTLYLTNNSLGIYANIGFVTLVGLIAKHGILITEFANQLREKGEALDEAILQAASLRLRPILMTTMAMGVGALPLALATGANSNGLHQMGWVIVGGLLFGTLFSLIVVPVAYSFFGKFKKIAVTANEEA